MNRLLIVGLFVAGAVAHARVQHHSSQPGVPAIVKPHAPFGIVAFDLNGQAPRALQTLGAGVVRGSCFWRDLEPARGLFDWNCADNVIMGAHALTLRSYMTVLCTPGWANGNRGCNQMPADISDWYFFVANFVTRYQNFNTILGVWNEPNVDVNLIDTVDGRNYALLFVNASNARNSVNPTFALAGPETSHHALASGYVSGALKAIDAFGALDAQDIVAVHWYPDGPAILDYMDAVHAVLPSRDVWLSETGIATGDLALQADFYNRALDTFEAPGRPWWTHVIFYRLWDGTDCCSESILRSDFSPKPAFGAYQSWILKLKPGVS